MLPAYPGSPGKLPLNERRLYNVVICDLHQSKVFLYDSTGLDLTSC